MASDSLSMDGLVRDMEVWTDMAAASVSLDESKHLLKNTPQLGDATRLEALPSSGQTENKKTAVPFDNKNFLLQIMLESALYKYLVVSDDIEDFKRRILVLINKLGFSDYAFTLMDTLTEIGGTLYSCPDTLCETYYKKEFYRHDLMLQYLSVCTKPIFRSTIDEFIVNSPFPTEVFLKNHELSSLLKSYGFMDYYVQPLKSEIRGQCLLFVFGKNMDMPTLRQKIEVCKGRLELLCCAIDHICSTRFLTMVSPNKIKEYKLTPRPLELLTYMAINDCTLYQAAEKMHISIKTANVHIATVKKTFGVSTSTAAVTHAIKYGLIKFNNL